MRVITYQLGRVILWVPTDEVAPPAGVRLSDVVSWLVDRYKFTQFTDPSTTPWDQIQKEGARFANGVLEHTDLGRLHIRDFTVYNDGFLASAHSTDVAEAFLADVLDAAETEFGFRPDATQGKRRWFLNEMFVEFEGDVNRFVKLFSETTEKIEQVLKSTYGLDERIALFGITFDYDRTVVPQTIAALAQFSIERRVEQPFADKHFFSRAPCRTRDHVALLEYIEALLSA